MRRRDRRAAASESGRCTKCARRSAGDDSAAVLGARKGETGDGRLAPNYTMLLMAAVALLALGKEERRKLLRALRK